MGAVGAIIGLDVVKKVMVMTNQQSAVATLYELSSAQLGNCVDGNIIDTS